MNQLYICNYAKGCNQKCPLKIPHEKDVCCEKEGYCFGKQAHCTPYTSKPNIIEDAVQEIEEIDKNIKELEYRRERLQRLVDLSKKNVILRR